MSKIEHRVHNSDLVVFKELALEQWTSRQRTYLYTWLQDRFSQSIPSIFTSNKPDDEIEAMIGDANMAMITQGSVFIECLDA